MRLAELAAIAFEPAHRRRLVVPTALLVGLIAAGFLSPGTWSFSATFAVTQALVALSVGMLFGRAGLLSLCPLAFAAISAWVVLWLNTNAKLPFFVMLAIGALAAVPAGFLVGGLALRLRGVNLAVVTLAFAVAVAGVFARHVYPGTLDAVYRPLRPVGFESDRMWFLLASGVLVVVGVTLEWLGRTNMGHSWRAVKSSERATAAAGLSVPGVKLSAVVVSAVIAGIAGGMLTAQLQGQIDNRSFSAILSLAVVAAAVMFGAQSLSGAVAAGLLAAMVPEIFRRLGWAVEYPQMLFGIGAIQALSQGSGGISASFPWRRPRRSERPAPQPPPPVESGRGGGPARTVLRLDDMVVRYGALAALDGVSLSVPSGSVVGIIGPNGAGKSTLVDAVCGFVDRYDGTITLDGEPLDRRSATRRARAGLRRTFQQGRAIEELTVGEYVRLYSASWIEDDDLEAVLGFFALPPADEPIGFVDVGTRRVIEVAACVAARPTVAFLDEPAAGLGAEQTAALADQIKQIPARFDCSVVLIEHDIDLVADVCSHVTVLDFGRVIARGAPDDVLRDEAVRGAYLGIDTDEPLVVPPQVATTEPTTAGDG